MVAIYNNKTLITKKFVKEATHETFKINKLCRIMWLLASLIILTFALIESIQGNPIWDPGNGNPFWYPASMFLYSIFCLFMGLKGDIFAANKLYKSFQAIYKGETQVARFYEGQIEIGTSQHSATTKYSDISIILQTQNLFLLLIKKQIIILNKEGFTIGDKNNFINFMKKKCEVAEFITEKRESTKFIVAKRKHT